MRRIIAGCALVCLLFSFNLIAFAQEQQPAGDHPMASFMDAKWGITAADFTQNFKYKDGLKLERNANFYYLKNFKLGELTLKKIKFKFVSKGSKDLQLSKRTHDSFILTEVLIFMTPEQFETLLQIFKVKYGEPTKYDEFDVRDHTGKSFLQKVARWENKEIKRMIIMERQASKLIDSMVMLIPIEAKTKKEKKDKIKEAAEKI
ncbi:MAG: hypothetical protein GTO45_18785 [Candidatus Aminicenantes bacterium]|nr:hypothetical protein [Candidatus Aminicenantes bacterium]NIM80835.1 hypothetical protein [Candidatus Aminicenantes bacterium]NIN20219.1 hypothetical protein [Candidatus Aminicenantes bacterium]NIN43998.1 hypothetical protein [Candidatus Aminicenantes bacterium]NIN86807.1 hypothetical protein [Candidatus Aminicenantes bacterium]